MQIVVDVDDQKDPKPMDLDLQYGDLAGDEQFVEKTENLKENLLELQKVLDKLLPLKEVYNKMPLQAQIELDLFLAFTSNSLIWVDLRLQGEDPTEHPVKDELKRIQFVMRKWQEVKDRDKRPTVNIQAAKRFVRSGLYDPYKGMGQPQNKKTKFEDDEE